MWQKSKDPLCFDLPAQCYLDDILVVGAMADQHLENIDKVMSKIVAQGLRRNKDKCLFFQKRVEYLGHVITPNGLLEATQTVDAMVDMPSPRDKVQLHSFIELT